MQLSDVFRIAKAVAASKPPEGGGWQKIPKQRSSRPGWRRRTRGGWEYRYVTDRTGEQMGLFGGAPEGADHVRPDRHQGEGLQAMVDRRRETGTPIVVSYGAGVDSTSMLVGLKARGIRPDAVVFADTGSEKPETYAYLQVMNGWLREAGFPEITLVKRTPTTSSVTGNEYATLEQNCREHSMLPSLAYAGRGCSQKWKHDPQEQWARNWPPGRQALDNGFKIGKLIGYDAGPADSRRPHIPEDDEYTYAYPLHEWGWDRERSKREIAKAGLPIPFKSSCFFCPASKPDELRQIATLNPDLLRRIIHMEAGAEHKLTKITGLWSQVKGHRGAAKKPGSMTEYIVGEELLPEFEGRGRQLAPPWWQVDGVVDDPPRALSPSAVVHLLRPVDDRHPQELPAHVAFEQIVPAEKLKIGQVRKALRFQASSGDPMLDLVRAIGIVWAEL